MRLTTGYLSVLLGCCTTFASAQLAAQATYAPEAPWLFRRQDACPGDRYRCPSSLGAAFNDICCQNGQTCALDTNNNPACCPSGVVCTGAAPTGQPGPTAAISYVDNTYFSFPYIPTEFSNRAACSSAVNVCDDNFSACTANLGGGDEDSNPLTIDVPGGGGVTVDATGQSLGPEATSICSSLRSEACHRLEATSCEDFQGDSTAASLRVPAGFATIAIIISCILHATHGMR